MQRSHEFQRPRIWKVSISDGPHLEECLNDMQATHEVHQIIHVGGTMVPKKNLITGKAESQTLVPFVMVIGKVRLDP